VVGVSVWDSPEDAGEFDGLFQGVLARLHEEGAYGIEAGADRVSCAVGFNRDVTERILTPIDGG
jgi:hypothetical protein